jgi:RNA polymerase sigma-70 factor, ECF subfamily
VAVPGGDERRARRGAPQGTASTPGRPAGGGQGGSPDDAVGARLDVDAALGDLPEEFRVAVVLRDLCDLDYAETAEVLGVPAGTVRSRIARGRSALAEALGNRGPTAERPTTETRPTRP